MLPSIVASELKGAVRDFLRSAFPIATSFFQAGSEPGVEPDHHALINGLIDRPQALFKGPYLDIKLPFRLAPEGKALPFGDFRLPFRPYQHQLDAFLRLCGESPLSTLVATGTGSGKTECFMFPVLDHCLINRERGIKAIVIYPMNALATDQARRFAEEIAKLDTRLTVGLFVGGEQQQAETVMGPDNVITCQRTLRENPPDILLTNYKMLDFLLIRPKDQPLWRFNAPGRLRYLVVDELHTFDGAQGTDLACLIRRLKARLGAGAELACVGTSATIGSRREALRAYARDVFATELDEAAVVGEDRLTPAEYLGSVTGERRESEPERFGTWPSDQPARLDPSRYASADDYLFHQARLWFDELSAQDLSALNTRDPRRRADAAVRLGELLHRHRAFHELIQRTANLVDMNDLAADWQARLNLPRREQAEHLLQSLLSLVSAARLWRSQDHADPEKWCQPLLQVRQQLWLRELRRMVCSVPDDGAQPALRFSDDLQDPRRPLHLPLLHCRECHLAAWGAVQPKGDSHLNGDLQGFYQAWFQHSPQARLLVPLSPGQDAERLAGSGPVQGFCPRCLGLRALSGGSHAAPAPCPECDDLAGEEGRGRPLRIWLPDILKPATDDRPLAIHHDCPECGARDAMAVVGYRAATLTSVMTGQLFATPFNDDHKLIAFSDSVQDAAHRAGFLGANTWRQVFRQAFQGWLMEQPMAPSLAEAAELMPAWWRDRLGSDERFCGLFIAPNMEWLGDYRQLVENGRLPPGSDLPLLVSRRLGWECIAEFGRRGTLGRSLERRGAAVPGWEPEPLAADVARLTERLREEIESLREIDDAEVMRFVLGWLVHLRQIGAIHHPVLEGYLANKGREYLLNRLPWMPGFGRSRRPPAAISRGFVTQNFEPLQLKGRESWTERWLKKTLGEASLFAGAEAQQILSLTVEMLEQRGWLVEREAQGQPLWLLAPERMQVSMAPVTLSCSDCRHELGVTPALVSLSTGMACLRPTCSGRLQQAVTGGQLPSAHYAFEPVAQRGQIPQRLVPSEHTGLLTREMREQVERSFIHGRESWDINLLSATPTLEMGIDIGALSSVFLCSVPPAQANYLQRIGRAGRRDGNALAVTVANGQNHDNFFFANPMEMIAGEVQTPGVFLQAIAVLERQLLAYGFDRWAATGIDDSSIPGQMRQVLDAVENSRQGKFPYTLMAFIAEHREVLLEGFFSLFERLDDDAQAYLTDFLHNRDNGGLEMRLLLRLNQMVEERASLFRKVGQLRRERDRLRALPEDDATRQQVQEVEEERAGHASLLSALNSQQVLNFLTDEGLLPNYAFPEEGVTLRSVILRRLSTGSEKAAQTRDSETPDGGDGKQEKRYEKATLSLQRSAQAALGELAPENRFYAVSHAMPIDQVDIQLTRVEQWRFCDRCQHTERVDLKDRHSACPRCGSAQWADSGQRHSVLKLRQVYATVDSRVDRIGDDAEQREPMFFNRQTLVEVDSEGHRGGFRLDSERLPFGFEFLARVTLREVNFGQAGGDANAFTVAGRESARRGFRICRHCGKVQKQRPRYGEVMHSFTCKLRRHPELETEEDIFESLYLYRELNSEAIRILLPLSEVAYSDVTFNSFVAALNLGLKAYFLGDVHHLEVTDMVEPAGDGGSERFYLVIYDRIPGGTGYLKELMREPGNLLRVLEEAYQVLASCECIDDPALDGCYRCLLAYRHSRRMPSISRRDAERLLGEILALRDALIPVASLGEIDINVLVESKLEQRFLDALGRQPGVQMTPIPINGKPGRLVTLEGADGRPMPWQLEHQVRMGADDGVAVASEIDVLLTPARAEDARSYRPIAVYLDGLQYHHGIVDVDVQKRQALLRSGRTWVFTLNWDDLPEPGMAVGPQQNEVMRAGVEDDRLVGLYQKLAESGGWPSPAELRARHGHGALDWLLALLREPQIAETLLRPRAVYRGLTTLKPAAMQGDAREAFAHDVQALAPAVLWPWLDTPQSIPGGLTMGLGSPSPGNALLVSLPRAAQSHEQVRDAIRLHLCLDDADSTLNDDFKVRWRAFWHAANQLQFLSGFSLATRRAVERGLLESLWQGLEEESIEPDLGSELDTTVPGVDLGAWRQAVTHSLLEPELLEAIGALGLPLPEVGQDIATSDSEVVVDGADVELCWPAQRVAIVEWAQGAKAPELDGWRFLPVDDSLLERLQQLMSEGVW